MAGRASWLISGGKVEASNAARLDLMRQTREQILRNASINLALDVLFGRLIALKAASRVNNAR